MSTITVAYRFKNVAELAAYFDEKGRDERHYAERASNKHKPVYLAAANAWEQAARILINCKFEEDLP